MISRRDVLKIGTAGLLAGSFTPRNDATTLAQEPGASVPMLGGNPERTGALDGHGPTLDRPVIVRWTVATGMHVASSPIIAGDSVFIYDLGLRALDMKSGAERWYHPITGSLDGLTPAFADGLVVVGTRFGLIAIDSFSASERWRLEYDANREATSPAIADGTVFVGNGGSIRAVDLTSGTERWHSEFGGGTPAIHDGRIYSRNNTGMCAIDATNGELLWSVNDSGGSDPVVVGDAVYYGKGEILCAINRRSGGLLWELPLGGAVLTPTVADGVVYTGNSRTRYSAIGADSGELLWQHDESGGSSTGSGTASVADGVVYVGSARSHGFIRALDAATGSALWEYETRGAILSAPVVANGAVYVVNTAGNIYAISNLLAILLATDTTIRGAPSQGGVERGTAPAGTEIDALGDREDRNGETWVEVTIDDLHGWIPLDAVNATTFPSEGDMGYIYTPQLSSPAETPSSSSQLEPAESSEIVGPIIERPGIQIDSRVRVTDAINVRPSAGTTADPLRTAEAGEEAVVIDGPVEADGFTWWELVFDDGSTGFIAEDFLALVP